MSPQTHQLPKLSDTQQVLLSAAATRDDGALLPWPRTLKAEGAARSKAIAKLLKLELIEERPVPLGADIWRRDDDNRALGLFLSAQDLAAVGTPAGEGLVEKPSPTKPSAKATAAPRPSKKVNSAVAKLALRQKSSGPSKQDKVLRLLRRKIGASLKDICTETGWQPHSARGFLSGVVGKKLSLALGSDKGKDGVRRYRIGSSGARRSK